MDDVAGVLLVLLFTSACLNSHYSRFWRGALQLWIICMMIEAKRSRDNGYRLVASPPDYEEYEDR